MFEGTTTPVAATRREKHQLYFKCIYGMPGWENVFE